MEDRFKKRKFLNDLYQIDDEPTDNVSGGEASVKNLVKFADNPEKAVFRGRPFLNELYGIEMPKMEKPSFFKKIGNSVSDIKENLSESGALSGNIHGRKQPFAHGPVNPDKDFYKEIFNDAKDKIKNLTNVKNPTEFQEGMKTVELPSFMQKTSALDYLFNTDMTQAKKLYHGTKGALKNTGNIIGRTVADLPPDFLLGKGALNAQNRTLKRFDKSIQETRDEAKKQGVSLEKSIFDLPEVTEDPNYPKWTGFKKGLRNIVEGATSPESIPMLIGGAGNTKLALGLAAGFIPETVKNSTASIASGIKNLSSGDSSKGTQELTQGGLEALMGLLTYKYVKSEHNKAAASAYRKKTINNSEKIFKKIDPETIKNELGIDTSASTQDQPNILNLKERLDSQLAYENIKKDVDRNVLSVAETQPSKFDLFRKKNKETVEKNKLISQVDEQINNISAESPPNIPEKLRLENLKKTYLNLMKVGAAQTTNKKKASAQTRENLTPEAKKTLQNQIKSLKQNRQEAVLLPFNEKIKTPENIAKVKTEVGTFAYNPKKISRKEIFRKVSDNTYHELLGHVEPKSDKTTMTVSALDKNGGELKTSLVSPENLVKQKEILQEQFPESNVVEGPTSQLAPEVLKKRMGPLGDEKGFINFDLSKPKLTPEQQKAYDYVNEMTAKSKAAKSPKLSIKDRLKNYIFESKKKIVDSISPIEDFVEKSQKDYKYTIPPEYDFSYQADRALRSTDLAQNFLENKTNLKKAIESVPDIDVFNEYLIAKHAIHLAEVGVNKTTKKGKTLNRKVKTGRDLARDKNLVEQFQKEYEPFAQMVQDHNNQLLQYMVDSDTISPALAKTLTERYPYHVPLKRIFDSVELVKNNSGTRATASLSKQNVIKNLEGSNRLIENVFESMIDNTFKAFADGEVNKAAKLLGEYSSLPGLENMFKLLPEGQTTKKPNISFQQSGKKRVVEVSDPSIVEAAKNLNVESFGELAKVLSAYTRLKKMGTTGANPAFAAANIVRDTVGGFINSSHGLRSSPLNIPLFFKSVANVLFPDNPRYRELLDMAAGGSSMQIGRNITAPTLKNLRRKGVSKIVATNPIKSLEKWIGKSEEFNRLMQYEGNLQGFLKKGMNEKRAKISAAKEAIWNNTNFRRKGELGPTIGALTLFLRAGIQGSNALVKGFKKNPKKFTTKVISTLLFPTAVVTSWNLSDSKRSKIYNDIEDFEKENNLIFVTDEAKKNKDGSYAGVFKIPLPPGIGNITFPVRRTLESLEGIDDFSMLELFQKMVGVVSPIEPSAKSIINQGIPAPLLAPLLNIQNWT